MRIRIPGALGAAAITLTLGLTGCSNPIEQLVESQVEQLVESQIGAEVELDGDGGFSIEGEDGSVQIGAFAQVPADFPADYPLPHGKLVSSMSLGDGWQLIFEEVDLAEFEGLIDYLSSSGHEEVFTSDQGSIKQAAYQNEQWAVMLLWEEGQQGGTVVYNVGSR